MLSNSTLVLGSPQSIQLLTIPLPPNAGSAAARQVGAATTTYMARVFFLGAVHVNGMARTALRRSRRVTIVLSRAPSCLPACVLGTVMSHVCSVLCGMHCIQSPLNTPLTSLAVTCLYAMSSPAPCVPCVAMWRVSQVKDASEFIKLVQSSVVEAIMPLWNSNKLASCPPAIMAQVNFVCLLVRVTSVAITCRQLYTIPRKRLSLL